MKMRKYTIKDFEKDFPTDEACLEWLKNNRYPDGIFCDKCQKITKHHKVTRRPAYACDLCGSHVYPMAGTILEHSATPLRLWFHAMFLMASTRCGISAKQLQRELGVTYKTAWRMFKQIRSMLDEGTMELLGQIEVDETYIGGHRRGKRGRGAQGKSIIVGMVERNGKVVTKRVADVSTVTLASFIKSHSTLSSTLYTDEFSSYDEIYRQGYVGKRVYHNSGEYVRLPGVHTNSIEGFWSLVKGGIRGVYRHVSGKHIQSYVNEFAFRYNRRKDEIPMFLQILSRLVPSLKA